MDTIPRRICKHCQREFDLTPENFYKDKKAKSGLGYICKQCAKAKAAEWLIDNREKNKENNRRRYYAKTDEYKAYKEAHREDRKRRDEANKEEKARKAREYRQANKDKIAESNRLYKQQNPGMYADLMKQWRKANPERDKATMHRRLGRLRMAEGTHTAEDLQALRYEQEDRCAYCGITLDVGYHVDHIIPLSRGGSNSADNLCLTCPCCNDSKGAKLVVEWQQSRGW